MVDKSVCTYGPLCRHWLQKKRGRFQKKQNLQPCSRLQNRWTGWVTSNQLSRTWAEDSEFGPIRSTSLSSAFSLDFPLLPGLKKGSRAVRSTSMLCGQQAGCVGQPAGEQGMRTAWLGGACQHRAVLLSSWASKWCI